MEVEEVVQGFEETVKKMHYEWLESMVGDRTAARVGNFLVMRTGLTWEEFKKKITEREERKLKQAKRRIQELEQELEAYKATAEEIYEACQGFGLKM